MRCRDQHWCSLYTPDRAILVVQLTSQAVQRVFFEADVQHAMLNDIVNE